MHAPALAQEADSVALRFGWRPGLTADVQHERTRIRTTPARSDTSGFRSMSIMRVAEHAEGLEVRSDSVVIHGMEETSTDEGEFAQRLLATIGALTPGYIINASGEFLRVTDLARLKAAADTLFQPLFASLDSVSPQARGLIEQALSEQNMTASMAQAWNSMVGTWIDAEWEVGAVYEVRTEEPIPLLPGLTVPMTLQFSAAGRVPCDDGAAGNSCVELQMLSTPDSAGMQEVLRQVFERFGNQPEMQSVLEAMSSMEVENEITVVTEPSTLVPHVVVLEKRVRVLVKPTDGDPGGETVQVDRDVSWYHYRK